jgi:hypothetical protein
MEGVRFGKSETCRASAWQSHRLRTLPLEQRWWFRSQRLAAHRRGRAIGYEPSLWNRGGGSGVRDLPRIGVAEPSAKNPHSGAQVLVRESETCRASGQRAKNEGRLWASTSSRTRPAIRRFQRAKKSQARIMRLAGTGQFGSLSPWEGTYIVD